MAVTVSVIDSSLVSAGQRQIRGSLTMDSSYATGGEVMDVSTYFAGSPTVVIGGADGYMLEHNQGTAAAGKVLARYSSVNSKNGANETLALVQVADGTDLSAVNTTFLAMGQSF